MADQDKTALQLAEAIARRVLYEVDEDETVLAKHDEYFQGVTYLQSAILEVLREHGVWLCRLSETEWGTVQTRLPMGDEG